MSTAVLLTPPTDPGASGDAPDGSDRPRDDEPVVSVRQLNHFFGEDTARNQVLFDLRLDVWAGQIIILTGPSGAGKTTLLTLVGALRSIQDGLVRVLGQELSGLDDEEQAEFREDVGFIFQAHNLFASLTAFQTVLMALELKHYPRGERRRRATEILTLLGLGDHLHKKPATLSGGQKQRVAIARALANRPRLILADEPTAALDEKSGRVVVNLLRRLAREEGCTSLIVSHEPRIYDVADRIVTMVGGRIQSDLSVRDHVEIAAPARTVQGLLAGHPDFAHLPLDILTSMAAKMVVEQCAAGSILFREGDEGDRLYLIWQGTADVLVSDAGGERLCSTLKAGEFFGETSLLTGKRRSATVRAREDVVVYVLDKGAYFAALEARSRTGL
jgi:putative ABC transport system ATP-binding protein